MKKIVVLGLLFVIAAGAIFSGWSSAEEWQGIDEAVVKKFAEQAGRPAREPYINTAQGDMLLFFFLIAGASGGFLAGYLYRGLFAPKTGSVEK